MVQRAATARQAGAAAQRPSPILQRLRFPQGEDRAAANETLLILSPVKNRGSGHHTPISHFTGLVDRLTWPKASVSVALLEGDSSDDTWEVMQEALASLHGYRSIQAIKKDFGPLAGGGGGGGEGRHSADVQLIRRQRLAQVRNWLLSVALVDHDWVLWMDSDLWEAPSDLVQQLMTSNKDLVVPNCIVEGSEPPRTYDLNSWQETPESRAALKDVPAGEPLFEGYGERPTFRKHIGSLGGQGNIVKLDGIGGSVILARGDLFRRGLNFPGEKHTHAYICC